MPRITAPTLVLAGDRDPFVPPKQARLIAENVHDAESVMFKDAGHILFLERPMKFRRVIRE